MIFESIEHIMKTNFQIRLSALGLIVETSRSTESLNNTDFELLKLFLEHNVNCEVPSFRQQTLSFTFKVSISPSY